MIICEIGLNHLGDESYSKYYFDTLSKSHCDAISYQIREPEAYNDQRYKGYQLSLEHYYKLKSISKKKFGFALADHNLLDEIDQIDPDFYKVLSWDLNNYEYIDRLLDKTDNNIYVSTGTSSINDLNNFFSRYGENNQINFIHTQLTEKPEDANLKAIKVLSRKFSYGIGYGNHCSNLKLILASIAFEPKDIWFYVKGNISDNKYFKDNRKTYPDDSWAVSLDMVDSIINDIKTISLSVGDGLKSGINTQGY